MIAPVVCSTMTIRPSPDIGASVRFSSVKTTLNLDDELLRRAKRRAQQRGSTLTSVVEDGLRAVLAEASAPAYRLALPVVEGAAPPAVDPADRVALYAILDLLEP